MNKRIKEDQELKTQIIRIWKMRTLQEVLIVVELLGSVAKNLDKLGIKISIHCSKQSTLLGKARILCFQSKDMNFKGILDPGL